MYLVIHWTLFFSEVNSKVTVDECTQGDYISDHCLITCSLGIDKPITTRKEIKYLKIKSVNIVNMVGDIIKHFTDSSHKINIIGKQGHAI